MKQVPNPFKVIDDFLLDVVFNPVTWWSEDKFGIDAMDVRIALTYIGLLPMLHIAFIEKSPLICSMVLVGFFGIKLLSKFLRDSWHDNNSTGKNISRIYFFVPRWCVVISGMPLAEVLSPSPAYLIMLAMCSWFLAAFVATYLDATDARPPLHRKFKTVSQL